MRPELRDWSLVYEGYRPEQEGLREALCTLGNGYFATRGAAPDSTADDIHYPGTYLAGGYNRLVSEVAGRKVENEDLVNMPNWLALTFRIDDGPWFRIDEVEILSFRQELDLRRGVLSRDVRFRDAEGRTTRWNERRIVSMADAHLAGLSVELTAEDWSGRLTVRSGLDGSVINNGVPRYRDLASHHLEILELDHLGADALFLRCQTNQSLIQVALAARTRLYSEGSEVEAACQTQVLEDRVWQEMTCTVEQGSSVTAEKIVALHTSRDWAISEAGLEAKRTLAMPAASTRCSTPTRSPGGICGTTATSSSRTAAQRTPSSSCASTSSICCRRRRRTPSISMSASRRAAGMGKPIAATSSGTSCSSSPSSACASRRSPGRCCVIAIADWEKRGVPHARRAMKGPCSHGRAAATGAKRPSSSTSTRNRGAGTPTTPIASATSIRPSPSTSGSTTRRPTITNFSMPTAPSCFSRSRASGPASHLQRRDRPL
jgi:hypothetical protein